MAQLKTAVWLVNTGWTVRPFGIGERIRINYAREMVRAALTGHLDGVPTIEDHNFRFLVPEVCPGVLPEVLNPRST
ncbi:MAG: phosphoenolpyruvate carboxykinase (ATP) [Anaerolineales bacterium]|nr:phosphoenolpyruvate carboxykinase (ATP) [Anaerolineales bacterium]